LSWFNGRHVRTFAKATSLRPATAGRSLHTWPSHRRTGRSVFDSSPRRAPVRAAPFSGTAHHWVSIVRRSMCHAPSAWRLRDVGRESRSRANLVDNPSFPRRSGVNRPRGRPRDHTLSPVMIAHPARLSGAGSTSWKTCRTCWRDGQGGRLLNQEAVVAPRSTEDLPVRTRNSTRRIIRVYTYT
jgi:hypothetical protein